MKWWNSIPWRTLITLGAEALLAKWRGSPSPSPAAPAPPAPTDPSSIGRVLAWLVAVLLLAAPAFAQSRVFYDGAEVGTKAPWDVNKCTSVALAPDGGTPAAGARMWRCGWNGTVEWTHPDKIRDMAARVPYGREVLIRYRVRYDANVDATIGSKESRVGYGSTGEVFSACQHEHGAGATWLVSGVKLATFWGTSGPGGACRSGWHVRAIYRRDAVNGAGGITRIWGDGVLLREWTGDTGDHGDGLNLPSNWSSNPGWHHDASNDVLFDEVEGFSDLSTGTPITGRLEDNTAAAIGGSGPAPCAGTWAETLSDPTPATCDASQIQTRTRTRTFTITTAGPGCPVSPVVDTVSTPCTYAPPAPAGFVGRVRSQAVYTASGAPAGLRVTLSIPATEAPPSVGASVAVAVPVPGAAPETRAGRVRKVTRNAYAGPPAEHAVEIEIPRAGAAEVVPIRVRVTFAAP